MKTALPYGILIGVLSGIWIFIIQQQGVHERDIAENGFFGISVLEYLSVLIPLTGLYFGIRAYKRRQEDGELQFFEALFHGFRILLIGGAITAFFISIYLHYAPEPFQQDYMGRLAAALLVGILLNLGVSLWHRNYPKNL